MNLLKTSFLSFLATATRMLSMLVINKAAAVFIGPAGLALIGQFQNFTQAGMVLAQGGINVGVTKYSAEYGAENEQLPSLFSTAAKISLGCSFVVGSLSIFFSEYASRYILGSGEFEYVFVLFGFTIPLFVINQLLLSVLNGLKEIKIFITASILQSVYGLAITSALIVFFGIDGALVALVTNQSVTLVVLLWLLKRRFLLRFRDFTSKFDSAKAKNLFGYSLMALATATSIPISQLIIRNYLGQEFGWDKAGYWQAVWYISTIYLMVLTTTLSIYYLPRLSEIEDKKELRLELLNGYRVIMPLVILMAVVIFSLRDFIVSLLFSEEFTPMRQLFAWQLVGDVLKLAGWLLAYLMLAKAMVKTFVVTEFLSSLMFVILSFIFVDSFGLIGVTYAFALNYLLYFFIILYSVRKILL